MPRPPDRDPEPAVWGAVTLTVPASCEEELLGALACGGLGVATEVEPDGRLRLRVYLATRDQARAAAQRIAGVLGAAGLDPAACDVRSEDVPDGRWVERYQAALRPFRLGRRFVVDPSGGLAAPAGAGSRVIRLVPGRAFGTGEHPTTRLCVERLEACVRAGERWLDLGCGSGILAVVAAPDAVEVAHEVVRMNRAEGVVEVVRGTLDAVRRSAWNGIVANVSAGFLAAQAEALAARLRGGGWLLTSGFVDADVAGLRERFAAAGLVEADSCGRRGWWALAHRRPGGR
jgi:ribosomal protein L11 methyltransferase